MPSEMGELWHKATQGRLTNTPGKNKTTPGHLLCLKLHPFFPPLFAPGPATPFGSKPAGLLSSFCNQLGRFPTGGCFRPGSQDAVSHKIVISVSLPALGQGGVLRTVPAAFCASGFCPSREAVPKMSSEEEHCFYKGVCSSLAQSRWQHSGRRVRREFPGRSLLPGPCFRQEMQSVSRQGWRSWEESLVPLL